MTSCGARCGVALFLALLTCGLVSAADVPARSEGGQTLAVPEDQLKLGDVYYVTPGEDTQVLVVSDAFLQRVAATCNHVVGYVVVPFDLDESQAPLLSGAFRIPVGSLKTSSTEYNGLLQSPPMLNAAEFPEITVRLARVSDVQLTGDEKGRKSYTLTLAAEVTVKNKTVELAAPGELGFIPFTWRTMSRNVGELLVLRTKFELKLADLGVLRPAPTFADRIADVLRIEVCLFCNTMSPEKNLDPAIRTAQFLKQMRFLTLVRDFNDPLKGYEFGRTYLREIWDDAPALNRLATATLTEDGIETRDLAFVLKAAQRANELTQFKDAALLLTLARACFERADLDGALKYARQAEQASGAPVEIVAEAQAAAQRYEAELGHSKP